MEIGAIFIPIDGKFYIKKQEEKDIFNNIGHFITLGKSTRLDTDICFHTEDLTYELITSPDNKDILNTYASDLLSTEIYGNAVLIASKDTFVSIDNFDVISKIRNQNTSVKFVSISDKYQIKQHYYPKSNLRKVINSVLKTDDTLKIITLKHFEVYGYSLDIYCINDNDSLVNNLATLLLNDFINDHIKSNKEKNKTENNESKDQNEDEDEDQNEDEENSDKNEDEENSDKNEDEKQDNAVKNIISKIHGDVIILNKYKDKYIDLTIPEIKKLCYISTYDLEKHDEQKIKSYLEYVSDPEHSEEYVVKNRYQYLNQIYSQS
tara:strand:+ start:3107 stop:4069 length:963 start_codon:yes stop_codon:yes gene_type:complete